MNIMADAAHVADKARQAGARAVHLLRVARRRARDTDVRVYAFTGELQGQLGVTVIFAGHARAVPEVRRFLFSGPVAVKDLGSAHSLQARKRLAGLAHATVDLLVWEAWETASTRDQQRPLSWEPFWLDAPAAPDGIGLTLRFTSDPADVGLFQAQMRVPSAQAVEGAPITHAREGPRVDSCPPPWMRLLAEDQDFEAVTADILPPTRAQRDAMALGLARSKASR